MKKFIPILIFLLTSITITGISYLDNKIWNYIIGGIALAAYGIVGLLYSAKLISGRDEGSKAFAGVFVFLLVVGLCLYVAINKFQAWVLTWPVYVKILVPATIIVLIAIVGLLMYLSKEDAEEHSN